MVESPGSPCMICLTLRNVYARVMFNLNACANPCITTASISHHTEYGRYPIVTSTILPCLGI